MEIRKCSKCAKAHPLDVNHFGHNPQGGFRHVCRECIRKVNKQYAEDNPGANTERSRARVARENKAGGKGVSYSEKRQIRCMLDDKCAYCRTELKMEGHFDHKIPVAKGGKNEAVNMTLACEKCNLAKHAKTVDEFAMWLKKCGMPVLFHPSVFGVVEDASPKNSAESKPNNPQQSAPSATPADVSRRKRIFVKRDPSTTELATQSVAIFAGELGLPLALLLDKLSLAGVPKQSGDEKITEHDKTVLLEYLRRKYNSSIVRPSITQVIRNKSIHGRANAEKITQELNALEKLRNYYFSMPLEQLMALWLDGKNELEEEDVQMIRIAIRNKSGIA